jgi:ABC-type xylose transport system permease subunit
VIKKRIVSFQSVTALCLLATCTLLPNTNAAGNKLTLAFVPNNAADFCALAAIGGMLVAFYTNSISPANHGSSYELYAIAAAVLGGCSLRGGEGSILGIVIGTALLQVLQNLVNLLGIPCSLNFALMGAVIFLGVLVDQVSGQRKKKQQVPTPAPIAPTSTAMAK